MKKIALTALLTGSALALAACGDAEDASYEAEADNVEVPANEAMDTVEDEPVEDADATAEATEEVADTVEAEADAAAENAEDVVADIEALTNEAMEDGEDAADEAEEAVDPA